VPAAAVKAPPAPPSPSAKPLSPPPQMRELDFMLGSFKCLDTPSTGQEPFYDYITTRRSMGGHYYESVMWTPGVIRAQRTWGWDPVGRKYLSQYRDDWGVAATSTAGPVKDGRLVSTGPVTLVIKPSPTGEAEGIKADVKEEIRALGRDHHTNVQSTTFPNGFVVTHTLDCHRR
uniref:hypothetical protein n=1 Tax=Actinomadura roseirufa TaxID=2094049 RepID=UPI0013F178B4